MLRCWVYFQHETSWLLKLAGAGFLGMQSHVCINNYVIHVPANGETSKFLHQIHLQIAEQELKIQWSSQATCFFFGHIPRSLIFHPLHKKK